MDAELLALCNQTITRYPFVSYDRNNDITWGSPDTFLARVEYVNNLILDKNGKEILSTCQIYCDGTVVIDERDKITITGAANDVPEIKYIQKSPDEFGNIDHLVIFTR